MLGNIPPQPPKDEVTVGHAFESALAYIWRAENPGWQLSPGEVQYEDHSRGFPALATIDRRARRGRSQHIVEFKTTRSWEKWGDPDGGQLPGDYFVQVQ